MGIFPKPQPQARVPQPTHRDVKYGPHATKRSGFLASRVEATDAGAGFHSWRRISWRRQERSSRNSSRNAWTSGISVAAITYRFSNQAIAPAPFQDGARAIQFLRSKAKEWNIDPKRIAATGRLRRCRDLAVAGLPRRHGRSEERRPRVCDSPPG